MSINILIKTGNNSTYDVCFTPHKHDNLAFDGLGQVNALHLPKGGSNE